MEAKENSWERFGEKMENNNGNHQLFYKVLKTAKKTEGINIKNLSGEILIEIKIGQWIDGKSTSENC